MRSFLTALESVLTRQQQRELGEWYDKHGQPGECRSQNFDPSIVLDGFDGIAFVATALCGSCGERCNLNQQ